MADFGTEEHLEGSDKRYGHEQQRTAGNNSRTESLLSNAGGPQPSRLLDESGGSEKDSGAPGTSAADSEPEPQRPARMPWRRSLDLESHTIEQNIWILALPLMAERLLQSLVDAADMAMVGRGVGSASVTAVGLSNQLSMVATGFYDAVRVGTTTVVARRIGAGRIDEANQTLRQSLLIATFLGLAAFLLISAFARESLLFMGAEPLVIEQGVPYFRWKGLSLLFEFITMTFTAALRGSGNTRLPMYAGTVVNILNLCGNYVLIGGNLGFPRLEAEGAGLGTAFARFCGMIVIIFLTASSSALRDFYKASFCPDKSTLGSILRVGLPASGERLTLRAAIVLYTRAVANLGNSAYAAHQIALRIESVSLTIGFSFGATTTTFVGQYLGLGSQEKAETAVRKCRNIAAAAMGIAGLLLFVTAPAVLKLFIPGEPEVVRLGSTVLRIVAVAQPFMAINHVLSGGLRGAGDTAWVMYLTGASAWGVRVVLTYLFVSLLGLHLPGAWFAMVADQVMRSILFQLRFRAGHWRRIAV